MTDIERMQRFIRIVSPMPPEVQKALLFVMEWQVAQNARPKDT